MTSNTEEKKIEEIKKKYHKQLKELEKARLKSDWEVVHAIFDQIIGDIAIKSEPEFVKYLDYITEDCTFWYA